MHNTAQINCFDFSTILLRYFKFLFHLEFPNFYNTSCIFRPISKLFQGLENRFWNSILFQYFQNRVGTLYSDIERATLWFGTPPVEALNNKIWRRFFWGGMARCPPGHAYAAWFRRNWNIAHKNNSKSCFTKSKKRLKVSIKFRPTFDLHLISHMNLDDPQYYAFPCQEPEN